MKRFLFSIFLLGGLSFALAALPVCGQSGEIFINKKPLGDFAETVRQLDELKRVDWTQPFLVVIEGAVTKEGKLAQGKLTKTGGDKELTEIAQRGIIAIGESGWLGYLSNLGVEKIRFVVEQTPETFSFTAMPEFSTPEKAKTVASGLNGVIKGALQLDKNDTKKLGDDERILLSSANVTAGEKTVNINISMPAGEFREMVRRRMRNSKEKTNG